MLALGFGATALASGNDLQLYRLGNPSDPDAQARFRMLGNELGIALSGTTLEPPNTLGMSGFELAIEYDFVFVNGGNQIAAQPYWVTEGPAPSLLMVPTVHLRKGLPFSFDIGVKLAGVVNSATFAATLELKWAPLEGFKNLPDFSTRFYVGARLRSARPQPHHRRPRLLGRQAVRRRRPLHPIAVCAAFVCREPSRARVPSGAIQ